MLSEFKIKIFLKAISLQKSNQSGSLGFQSIHKRQHKKPQTNVEGSPSTQKFCFGVKMEGNAVPYNTNEPFKIMYMSCMAFKETLPHAPNGICRMATTQ